MSAEIRVYQAPGNTIHGLPFTIFPIGAPDPDHDSLLRDLIESHVELYVNFSKSEIMSFLPSQTTVHGMRREDLCYHYKSKNSTTLVEEFCNLLEVLHESDVSSSAAERTAEARSRELPESLLKSGIFEEGWSFDESEILTQITIEFTHTESGFPGLSRFQREVVLDTIGEQRLVLGIKDISAGLQAIQYFLDANQDVTVVIASREDAKTITDVDLVLILGADRNFEPLDNESESALNKTGDKIENWTAKVKEDATDAVDQILKASNHSNSTIHRDLQKIESFIRDDESVEVNTDEAGEVITIISEIKKCKQLTDMDRKEVNGAILKRIGIIKKRLRNK